MQCNRRLLFLAIRFLPSSFVRRLFLTLAHRADEIFPATTLAFADNSPELLRAYVDSGEGIDRAGGFAIQGLGGMLIKKIDGDYNNAVGFPAQVRP